MLLKSETGERGISSDASCEAIHVYATMLLSCSLQVIEGVVLNVGKTGEE